MARSEPADRLTDPGEHFPYKRDDALEALEDTDDGEDYTSEEIVEATAAYVDAQQAYLENPSDGTAEGYRTAADDLVLARQFHRSGRAGLTIRADSNPQEG